MAPWRPEKSATRATTLAVIAGLHLAALVALATLAGPRAILHRVAALEVHFVPPAPHAVQPPPPPRVPLPALHKPELALPALPPIEVAISTFPQPAITADVPPSAQRAPVQVMSAPVSTDAAPVKPPQFDLAYLRNPAPPYPPLSRRLKEEGRVMLRVRVDAEGQVAGVELAASSGHARLDQAALSAVQQWRFTPARAGERAVAGWAMVPVVFQLNG